MKFPPYHIKHINLHQQPETPALDLGQSGHYLVFWWREIPLGHLFIKPQEKLSEKDYYQKLKLAIRPALQQYAKEPAKAQTCEALLEQNQAAWSRCMEEILSPSLTNAMPATVPVSVVICTRNRASTLKTCLESLRTMPCQPEEIVIIDNAPSDDSTRQVVEAFSEARYYVEPRPGLSYARNTGLQKASQPIIAFTDDDVLVHPHWIYRVWQSFEDTQTAAITGLVLASELKTETQLIFEQHWSFNRGFADILFDQNFFQNTLAIGPPV